MDLRISDEEDGEDSEDEDIEDDEVAAMKTTKEGKQFLAVLDNAIKKIKDM